MTLKVVTHDTDTGICSLSDLTPYPVVQAGSNVTVTPAVDPATGQRTFTVSSALDGNTTNLGYTPAANQGTVTSDTGTDAVIPLANVTNAGLLRPLVNDPLRFLRSDGTWVEPPNDDFSPVYTSFAALIADGKSGGTVFPTWTTGGTVTVPDGTEVGQRINIAFPSAGVYEEMLLAGSINGLGRGSDHAIKRTSLVKIVRSGEAYQLVWDGSTWRVINYDYRLFNGGGWTESEDGTAEIRASVGFNAGSVPPGDVYALDVVFPIQIDAAASQKYVFADVYSSNAIPTGIGPSVNDAASAIYVEMSIHRTPVSTRVMARNVSTTSAAIGGVQVIGFGVTPDYAALGGIASF